MAFRLDYIDEWLVVKLPHLPHEILPALITELNGKGLLPGVDFGSGGNIRLGGSSFIYLSGNSKKSSDEQFFDRASDNTSAGNIPTVVFEVGFSQTQTKLSYDAARILTGSGGLVQLVVNIKIYIEDNSLQSVDLDFWEMYETRVEDVDAKRPHGVDVLVNPGGEQASESNCLDKLTWLREEKRDGVRKWVEYCVETTQHYKVYLSLYHRLRLI